MTVRAWGNPPLADSRAQADRGGTDQLPTQSRRRRSGDAAPVPGEGDHAAGLRLTIHIAAKRSPAADGAVHGPAAEALIGALGTNGESDRASAHASATVPRAGPGQSDPRGSAHAVSAGLPPIRPSVA
jgi:hypothetical protein